MNEQLTEIQASLNRIEATLTIHTDQFTAHVADDAIVAANVRALARQRGYFSSGLAAVGAGIAAAATYLMSKLSH